MGRGPSVSRPISYLCSTTGFEEWVPAYRIPQTSSSPSELCPVAGFVWRAKRTTQTRQRRFVKLNPKPKMLCCPRSGQHSILGFGFNCAEVLRFGMITYSVHDIWLKTHRIEDTALHNDALYPTGFSPIHCPYAAPSDSSVSHPFCGD